jgi:hypothetical protein
LILRNSADMALKCFYCLIDWKFSRAVVGTQFSEIEGSSKDKITVTHFLLVLPVYEDVCSSKRLPVPSYGIRRILQKEWDGLKVRDYALVAGTQILREGRRTLQGGAPWNWFRRLYSTVWEYGTIWGVGSGLFCLGWLAGQLHTQLRRALLKVGNSSSGVLGDRMRVLCVFLDVVRKLIWKGWNHVVELAWVVEVVACSSMVTVCLLYWNSKRCSGDLLNWLGWL